MTITSATPRSGISTSLLAASKALEWGCLLGALVAFSITESYQPYISLGLAALVISFVTRLLRTGIFFPITGLEAPVFLFTGSAVVASWAAYDQPLALLHLARILAGAVLFAALVQAGEKVRVAVVYGLILAAAGLAVYFPLQHDFAASTVKFSLIAEVGQAINSQLAPAQAQTLLGSAIHPNVAAGALGVAAPFAGALALGAWQEKKRAASLLAALALALSLAGLAMTSSRGAWMGLAFSGGVMVLLAVQRRWFSSRRAGLGYWALLILSTAGSIWWGVSSGVGDRVLGRLPDAAGSLIGRAEVWNQSQALLRDYFFTGSGLQSFRMQHAVYGVLILNPALDHIHNTLLEVWIEQGILGFAALMWGGLAVLAWARRACSAPISDQGIGRYLQWAAFMALAMAALHGMFDSVLYVTRILPLVGLALGLAYGHSARANRPAWFSLLALGVLLVSLGCGVYFSPALRAMYYANLGAVSQARSELGMYDPAEWDKLTLDNVRQTAALTAAEAYYHQSLQLDPNNVTALTRLGQIDLSRAHYERAHTYLEQAWAAGNRDDVTRLLYGDVLIARGEIEAAANIVQGVNWAKNRILGQAWYRYWLANDYDRAAHAWSAVLLLDPGNDFAEYWKNRADDRRERK